MLTMLIGKYYMWLYSAHIASADLYSAYARRHRPFRHGMARLAQLWQDAAAAVGWHWPGCGRMPRRLYVDLPDAKAREHILQCLLKVRPRQLSWKLPVWNVACRSCAMPRRCGRGRPI